MTERFYSPVIKYTTSALRSLPGALLYFYETETTTPKTTWSDPDRTTPNAHPVVALADGTFPAIFIDGIYRVELKSSAGVTQPGWPVDDVGVPSSGFPFQDWSSTYSYSEDDIVIYNGDVYQSLDDDNEGNIPSSSPLLWQKKLFFDAPTAESYLNGNSDGTYTWYTIAQTKAALSLPTDTVSELALKAPLASPTFTGNPTAPTPLANDNGTSIATTAYVQTELLDRVQIVDTFSDLATTPAVVGQEIWLTGHTQAGIGGGIFYGVAGTIVSDGGFNSPSATVGVGFSRPTDAVVTPEKFGAIVDGSTDNTSAIMLAYNYLVDRGTGGVLFFKGYGSDARWIVSGSGIQTFKSDSYYRAEEEGIIFRGEGLATQITRLEDQASDVIDFADESTFHNSIFNIHNSNNTIEDMLLTDAKSALYLGQKNGSVDDCHVSWNKIKNVYISNCGAGVHMRSGEGVYYNSFDNIHIWQCQVGTHMAKHPDSLISAANVNRNNFKHYRHARCHVGLWLVDGDTNQFLGQHNEGNSLTPTSNRYAVPSGLPYGLTGGIGQLLETNAINNDFVACMQEGCEVELVNGGERNGFDGLYRDENSGKVRHIARPRHYFTRSMFACNAGRTFYFTNSQTDIYAGYSAGFIHNLDQVRSSLGFRIDTTSTDYTSRYGFDLGAMTSGGTAAFTIWEDNSDEASSTASFQVTVTGNSDSTNVANTTRFDIVAQRDGSRNFNRYYAGATTALRANGAGTGDTTEPFTPALSLSGTNKDLIVTLTAPARAFESVNVFVTRCYSKS